MKNRITHEKLTSKTHNLVGYLQGDKLNKIKELSLADFDEVIKVKESENTIDKKIFTQAVGYRNGEPYFLILNKL